MTLTFAVDFFLISYYHEIAKARNILIYKGFMQESKYSVTDINLI